MPTGFSRRSLLKTLLALAAGSVFSFRDFPACAAAAPWREDHAPDFANFRALCAFITKHDDLDANALQRAFDALTEEAWGPSHMTRLHRKIGAVLEKNPNPPALASPAYGFDDGEAWFARHILTIFYTGVFENAETPPQRLLPYRETLMYPAVAGVLPVPFLEPVGYGNWTTPPVAK